MAARAIWKGSLMLGMESVPVKLYSAVEDRSVHFHVLDRSTMTRVQQRMVNPDTGAEVPKEQIKRGYEVVRGTFVLLDDEDLEKAQPEQSRDIDITHFVPASHIHQQWYDRPYYLGPDNGSSMPYFALAAALEHAQGEGVAHWAMRKNFYIGALRSQGGYLLLITMKYAEEVLNAEDLPRPSGRSPDPKELQMAEQLISALQDDFRPEDFRDEYRERVMKFIEAKAHGQKPKLRLVPKKKESKSLMESLAASIKAAKQERAVA